MANIRDEVHKLNECLKNVAKHCEAEGTDIVTNSHCHHLLKITISL